VPAVPTLAQLQQQLRTVRQQGQPTPALLRLSYAEAPGQADAEGGGALDVVLVMPDGAPQGWRSPIALPRLRELLRGYYTALAEQRSGAGEAGSPERILFDLVLRPALPSLEQAGIGTLILSADPSLIDIPFSALHDGEQYLGERYSLAVTPSLAFTNLAAAPAGHAAGPGRRMQAGASTFFNGLTPLPMVEQELSRLADQQEGKATTLLNQQFTPVTFAQAFADPGTRQVHIASHAEIAAGKEKAPRIYTSQEVIGLRELGRLRQRSSSDALDLVTLSACRSALNAADLELGFAGLAVQMGARSAIGTKWYVDDTAMSSFFVMFYDQLQRGSSKAEALRTTQRAFARGEVRVEGSRVIGPGGATLLANLPESYQHRYGRGFSHPYYWAGVQLVGSPW
jgi:CHAT domain-containing protein